MSSPPLGSPLYIAGTGSFAAEIADWAIAAGHPVSGLAELRDPARVGTRIHGLEVVPLDDPPAGARALLGVGGDRGENAELLRRAGWELAGLVHPSAQIAADARVSGASTVGPLAVIGAATEIGAGAIVSRGALIGHHVRVGDFATLNPGVNVGGNAEIGTGAFLGMGCVVVNGVTLPPGVTVAAGAVVIGDVGPEIARVQGVPARPHR